VAVLAAALPAFVHCSSKQSGPADAGAGLFHTDAGWVMTRPAAGPRVRGVQTGGMFTLGLTDANTIAKVRSDAAACRLNQLLNTLAAQAVAARCTADARNVRALPTLLVTCQHEDSERRCVLQYTAELWGEGLPISTRAYDVKLFGRLAWICPDDAHLEDAMEPTPEAKETFAQMTAAVRKVLEPCE